MPIRSITRESTYDKFIYSGEGTPQPCFANLFNTLQGIQKGSEKDTFGWCTLIEEPGSYMVKVPSQGNDETRKFTPID